MFCRGRPWQGGRAALGRPHQAAAARREARVEMKDEKRVGRSEEFSGVEATDHGGASLRGAMAMAGRRRYARASHQAAAASGIRARRGRRRKWRGVRERGLRPRLSHCWAGRAGARGARHSSHGVCALAELAKFFLDGRERSRCCLAAGIEVSRPTYRCIGAPSKYQATHIRDWGGKILRNLGR